MKRTALLILSLATLLALNSCNSSIQNSQNSSTQGSGQNPARNSSAQSKPSTQKPLISSSENHTGTYSISQVDFITSQIGYLRLNAADGSKGKYALLKTRDGGKQWTAIKSNSEIYSINFVNETTGYGLTAYKDGYYNAVKTTDGGENWSMFSARFLKNKNIIALNALSDKVIYISYRKQIDNCADFHILRSIDGGATWAEVKLPDDQNEWVCDYCWVSANQGYMLYHGDGFTGNEFKTLYYTKDGGQSWEIKSKSPATLGSSSEEAKTAIGNIGFFGTGGKIKFFANHAGYLYLSNYGSLLKSIDGGVTFSAITDPNEVFIASIPDFISIQQGYTIFRNSNSESLMYTSDGGKSWVQTTDTDYLISKILL